MKYFLVIVLYNCKLEDSKTFISIRNALLEKKDYADLLVYDNSKLSQKIAGKYPNLNIEYFHDSKNSGLGAAYNKGARIATEKNYKRITLLDQDTIFDQDFFIKLDKAIIDNPQLNIFAPILVLKVNAPFSPTRYKFKRGSSVFLKPGLKYSLFKYSPVNSGLTVNLDLFNLVGGYDESVFLDFADFQFIEKVRVFDKYFFLVDTLGIQEFSNDETDVGKLNERFIIYCQCAKNCKRRSWTDNVQYNYAVVRHCMGLTLRTKNFIFFKNYLKYFLR